jgi:hypothetical protein
MAGADGRLTVAADDGHEAAEYAVNVHGCAGVTAGRRPVSRDW